MKVSIFIPSRGERFLNKTIQDVLTKAKGDIEVFPILDGYPVPLDIEIIKDPRVYYIQIPKVKWMQKRQGVNCAASIAQGDYFMCLDAHCMVAEGFDEVLKEDMEKNWVVIPRRYKLEPETWTTKNHLDNSLPVDYEYWIYQEYRQGFLKPYRWDSKAIERKDIMIDDTMTMQASCWFMHRDWFKARGFMRVDGYTGWGQEDVEIAMETHINGGRVMVNKNTWYAHLYKGKNYGRGYKVDTTQWDVTKEYGHRYWTVERKEDFAKVIKKFMPIPNWGAEWS
jgi:hypothetical protein